MKTDQIFMKKSIWFIINPNSGNRRKDDIANLIYKHLDHLKFDYEIKYSAHKDDSYSISKTALKKNIDIVCAIGGDGSVHDVGTALIGSKTALAIIPIGSGNGIARHMQIPLKVKQAILCINDSFVIEMDTVLVNENYFLGFGGYGLDALIAKRFNEDKKRGLSNYIKHVLKEYFKYKPLNICIHVNGQIKKENVIICTIANTSEFGNGFIISPKSVATDGIIELILIKPILKWKILFILYKFFNKHLDRSRFSEVISFKQAKLNISDSIAQYDGETIEVKSEINIQVVPKSLNIIIKKR